MTTPKRKEEEKILNKETILSGIHVECKDIAKGFFECMEEKYVGLDKRYRRTLEEFEKISHKNFIPQCMDKYDIEDCLANV